MSNYENILICIVSCTLTSCIWVMPANGKATSADTLQWESNIVVKPDILPLDNTKNRDTILIPVTEKVSTGGIEPSSLVSYAETLIGVPYVYASTESKIGFDCSGFITHVFNHFNISVPRSSVDFTHVGITVPVEAAKRGDIILFTGTNPAETAVGHMGLVVSNNDTLQFIHSTSGKAMGVTTTPLNEYYKKRFVRISRIFPQNE